LFQHFDSFVAQFDAACEKLKAKKEAEAKAKAKAKAVAAASNNKAKAKGTSTTPARRGIRRMRSSRRGNTNHI